MLLPEKTILVGQCQVHPGILNRGQRLNGPRQLTLQTALEREPLLELGHAKAVRLHHLKASHRALGQPQRSQPQARVMNLVGRHQDGAATFSVFIRHVHLRQLRHNGAAVLVGQVAVKHAPFGLTAHHQAHDADHHKNSNSQTQAHALRRFKASEALTQSGVDWNCRGGSHGIFRFIVARHRTNSERDYSVRCQALEPEKPGIYRLLLT